MSLLKRVKLMLKTLDLGIKQLPEYKKPQNINKVQALLKKYSSQSDDDLQRLEKQLNKRLKFLELAHPKINFSVIQQLQKEEEQKEQKQQQQQKQGIFKNKTIAFQQLQRKIDPIIDTNVRQEVNFSNWAEGNIDPEHLKRHKYLLDRQHFKGPQWQNKQLPNLTAMDYLESINETRKIDINPQFYKQKSKQQPVKEPVNDDSRWQTFRR